MNPAMLILWFACLLGLHGLGGGAGMTKPAQAAGPESKGAAMHEVSGTFEVKLTQAAQGAAETIASRTMEKTFSGGLTGTSKGEMLSAGDPASGNAGYVAIEHVEGKLEGRTGTFALMQIATMSKGAAPRLEVMVVPGSGTGELSGMYGTMTIAIGASGAHSYTLRYDFAQ